MPNFQHILSACVLAVGCDQIPPPSQQATAPGSPALATPASSPELKLLSVEMPVSPDDTCQIRVELSANGASPVAFARNQFTVHILGETETYIAEPIFSLSDPEFFVVNPGASSTLRLKVGRFQFAESAATGVDHLPAGKYQVIVYVNSGKSRDVSYQWLGQTYSNRLSVSLAHRAG